MISVPTFNLESLPTEVPELHQIIRALCSALGESQAQFESLKQQVLNLRRAHFGQSAERTMAQPELFTEPVTVPVPPVVTETITYERAKAGRPALPKDLARVRMEHDLPEADKACTCCGGDLERIGEETSEQLDYIPAQLQVITHARAKYACRCGSSAVKTAELPAQPLPKSNASANLLAHVLVSKYQDHLPLNRMERIFARNGVAISRSTLCDWVLGSTELLSVLTGALTRHVLASPRIHADDTIVPLQVPEKKRTVQARAWAYVGAGHVAQEGQWIEHPAAVVYEFTDSRRGEHVQRFLKGYQGYLQADAYAGFDALYVGGAILEVGCWAHARRKFFDIAATQPTGLAHEALAWIGSLYEIERTIKDDSPDKKREIRQREALPRLTEFRTWLQAHLRTLLPRSPLAGAFGYTLSNWTALTRYPQAGILEIDNNLCERAMRPIAIGRKNWLFAGSERGGRAAAIAYSLIQTCTLHDIEPFAYLADILKRLPSHKIKRVSELLPFNWKKAQSEIQTT
ncbi:MAG: IS66 family transposase [Candidatus Binataceae bacterium]